MKAKSKPRKSRKPAKTSGPGLARRLLTSLWNLLPAVLVLTLLAWAGLFAWMAPSLPDTDELVAQSGQARVTLIADDGSLITERGVEGQAYVKLDQISPLVEKAVLATEDRRFYSHFGLDIVGTTRALLANLSAGGVVAGGSTITQQLAKNLYLTPERSLTRKVRELILALWLEAQLSKTEILEVYLNRVYLGAGAYGVEAASQRYFAKSAANLDLAEAAMLAGLLKAPSRYAPTRNLASAQARSATVARLMAEQGMISSEQAASVKSQPATLNERRETGRADDFSRYVLATIADDLGKPDEGLVVRTSLNRQWQAGIERIVEDKLKDRPKIQAGVVILNAQGQIKAMMGGRSRIGDHRNRAADLLRQPGSAFKTIVYASALERGFGALDLVTDEPFTVDGWSPRNAGGRYFGRITLKEAYARSLNTVAVKLAETVGREPILATAKNLGITAELEPIASLALGTEEITVLELAGAYQPIIADGIRHPFTAVQRIADEESAVLFEATSESQVRVMRSETAEALRDMMIEAVANGSGRRAAVAGRVVGGKTGTTQNSRDAWFVGFSGPHIIAVWLGRDDQVGMEGVSGSNLPAEIFASIARLLPAETVPLIPKAKPGQNPEPQEPGGLREDGLARLIDFFGNLLN